MQRALVTGGAGFIGSNLVWRLLEEGWDVSVVDDSSSQKDVFAFLPKKSSVFVCDFSDDLILKKIHKQTYDVVFHLAARPRVSYSIDFPSLTTDNNINKPVKLLEACRGNVRRFINTSSSSVYGIAKQRPTPETTLHNPRSPYALQKSTIENFCKLFSELYDLDTVSIRPFNVFGPHQVSNGAYSTAICAWLNAVKRNLPLRSDGDGTQAKDMTYIDNVVDLFVKCANHSTKFNGEAFNAGSGGSIPNYEILDWFKTEYPQCKIVNAPARSGDVKFTQADMSKAETILGWRRVVGFWDGLELTREWSMNSELF